MPLLDLPRLRATLPKNARLLGLDPGEKTIGIAISDISLLIASPYGTLKRAKLSSNAVDIEEIASREGAAGFVCGFPLSMNGSLGPAAQRSRDWVIALSEKTSLPGALWDERLTTRAVNRLLTDEADLTRIRRVQLVDKLSAAYILQSALDASMSSGSDGGRDRV